MDKTLVIKRPQIEGSGPYKISAQLEFPTGTELLWFETALRPVDVADSFLVSVLHRAIHEGLDIVVDAPMSSQLYYNVTQYYLAFLRTLYPKAWPITIRAEQLTTANHGGTGVFTGFSAGVDSFATILGHTDNVPDEYRVTHLLFNNVGSHGQSKKAQQIFTDRLARLETQAMGLPLLPVTSNLDEVMRADFQLTHTLRNCATALLFQSFCAKFLYSAAVHYRDSHIGPTHDIGLADAVGVALLSTETTQCISSGAQHTRFEKTELISQHRHTFHSLDVCVQPQAGVVNCSSCWKCLRTELSLEIAGALPNYRQVFNLDEYRRVRTLYIASILRSPNPLAIEIADQIRIRNFNVPVVAAMLQFLPQWILLNAIEVKRNPLLFVKRIYWRYSEKRASERLSALQE